MAPARHSGYDEVRVMAPRVRESPQSESGLSRMQQHGAATNDGGMTMALRRRLRCVVAAVVVVGCVAAVASASAPPVGPLPAGSVSDITAQVGTLVAMATSVSIVA
jgi:hypothetical protein